MSSTNGLTSKAMLERLTIRQWTARRLDKKITQHVTEEYSADPDAGRWNKLLIPKEALRPLEKHNNEVRGRFYSLTLPWQDEGARILPAAAFRDLADYTSKAIAEHDRLADRFTAQYPGLLDTAEHRLNGMFNKADYPPPEEVRGRFSMGIHFAPLPTGQDFRVDLAQADADAIRQDIEAQTTAAVADAVCDLYARLRDALAHAAERLGTDGAIFRDSLIQNIRDLAAIIPKLNLTNDARLNQLAADADQLIGQQDPQALRAGRVWRKTAAQNADRLAKVAAQYAGAF